MYTSERINPLIPRGSIYNLSLHCQNETDSSLPSGLEISSLLDSGASFSPLNIAT